MATTFLAALLLVTFSQGEDYAEAASSTLSRVGAPTADRPSKESRRLSVDAAQGFESNRQHRFVRSESRASTNLATIPHNPAAEEDTAGAVVPVAGSSPVRDGKRAGDAMLEKTAAVETAEASRRLHGSGGLSEDRESREGDPIEEVEKMRDLVIAGQIDMANPILTGSRWETSDEHVKFTDGEAFIPKGSWIRSKWALTRPTAVQAKIKSEGAAGDIAMTVFAKDQGASSIYSVTTGFGEGSDEARAMPGQITSSKVFSADTDNSIAWQTILFELRKDNTIMSVDGSQLHMTPDVSLMHGHVQFIAMDQPMKVKEVEWRLHCTWSQWIDEACSVSCGSGTMKRSRSKSRDPSFGGAHCEGQAVMHEPCNAGSCAA